MLLLLTMIGFSAHTQSSLALGVHVGGSVTSDRRAAVDFFKSLWHEWEPPGVVLLSLTIQIFLIIMGKRRRYTYGRLSTLFTWIAYLSADAVAVYAIGIITTRVVRASLPKKDHSIQLNAFWAPFLLLHLGGPETITAYSLEDNELWSRHLLSLCTQAGMSLYVFVATWNDSALSALTIGMLLAGLIKYGERVCVLWLASSERFRRSISSGPSVFSKVVEEQKLMIAEGFRVVPHQVNEVPLREDILQIDSELQCIPNEILTLEELSTAEALFRISQPVFVDFSLFTSDRDKSRALLDGRNFWSIFKIIEIELGLMFDVLYTKAYVAASAWGAFSRTTTIVITVAAMVIFSLVEAHRNQYSPAELRTTLVLLGGAIFLEGYALTLLVFSDKMACWLIRKRKLNTLKFMNMFQQLSKRQRWSNTVAQFSILSYSLREKHRFYDRLLRSFQIDEKIYKYVYRSHESIPENLKWSIMERTADNAEVTQGKYPLEKLNKLEEFEWSIELEVSLGEYAAKKLRKPELKRRNGLAFDQSVIVWHIATELVLDSGDNENRVNKSERSISCSILSRYMMYLLIHHPQMLPTPRITSLKFMDTYIEAMNFFVSLQNSGMGQMDRKMKLKELRQSVMTDLDVTIAKEDRRKFLLFHGCRLAAQIDKYDTATKEEIICNVWIEKLVFAAKESNSKYHCQQLRMGGELLTHVWLLLAHYGRTNHFQELEDPSVVELVVT
ncbi:hypothetical protein MLD38_037553 [Melastoma candidum]|uniref:Uncharacterized protein n=1 Tax=Melastoma candidum TaxID=119954 RepID=A0ACB9LNE8_9MYRT|nr:hypothetical protein MLD38_037553 [Melastoma candidum]